MSSWIKYKVPRSEVNPEQRIPTRAAAPFNKNSADVILRTADEVDFHLHKVVLMLAGSVFEDMFSIPQPAAVNAAEVDSETDLPVVRVTETSKTLDALLRLCYPTADPVFHGASEVVNVLEAVKKYHMDDAVTRMGVALRDYVQNSPLQVYAVACRTGSEEVAREAAIVLFTHPTIAYVPEMEQMSAGALHRLLLYRGSGVQGSANQFTFCRPATSNVFCQQSRTSVVTPLSAEPFTHPYADVIILCLDDIRFRVISSILKLVSPILSKMVNSSDTFDPESGGNLPLIKVTETSRTMRMLLQLCYPVEEPHVEGFDAAHALLAAVKKYQVASAMNWARRTWVECIGSNALRACLLAMRMKWEDEMREAARLLPVQKCDWCPEMEGIPAPHYRMILECRLKCQKYIMDKFGNGDYNASELPDWSKSISLDLRQYGLLYQHLWCRARLPGSNCGEDGAGPARDVTLAVPAIERAGIRKINQFHRYDEDDGQNGALQQLVKSSEELEHAFAVVLSDVCPGH